MESNSKKCCTNDDINSDQVNNKKIFNEVLVASFAFVIMCLGIILDYYQISFFQHIFVQLFWYGIPLLFVGIPVLNETLKLIIHEKDFFNELSLMSLATIGAFCIGEYAEGLGVMVFYTIGEVIQDIAVSKAKGNIKSLLDVRPDKASLLKDDKIIVVDPTTVEINDIIEVHSGEKVPLDGVMLSEKANFNTAALTGESVPSVIRKNEEVLAGMFSTDQTVRILVNKSYDDSALSRILKMVQEASEHKSPTEKFIRKFARIYTPIVFLLAIGVVTIPYFFDSNYIFTTWFYRSLIFLVISCPCALVISVPLGYFGGIGLGSHYGILFKGGNYLEAMTYLHTLVTDKTGTITKGVFTVQDIHTVSDEDLFLSYLASIEKHSTHPIAKAIVAYTESRKILLTEVVDVHEIAGYGLKGIINNSVLIVGNKKLMDENHIMLPEELKEHFQTTVFLAYNGSFMGCLNVADELKDDTIEAIKQLHQLGVNVIMLSGDKQKIADEIAQEVGIDEAYGDLLPGDKAEFFEKLKKKQTSKNIIAFVGDGINDAPVLALSDVGISMGGLGSDLAVETSDIVIQTDEPSKIPQAILIAKATRTIVVQNISVAMTVKFIVLILGIFGLANMWEAIFSDVGVSLLATLNSARLLYKKI